MTRWLSRMALVLVLGSLVAGGWLALPWMIERMAAEAAPVVPTVVLERQEFRRSVIADGNLAPVVATRLNAPSKSWQPFKIAWLEEDGATVTEDQVVARFDPTDFEKELEDGLADRAIADGQAAKEKAVLAHSMRVRDSSAELAELELQQTRKFQSVDEDIFSRHQIIESAIDERLSTARMEHAGKTKKIERKVAASKMALVRVQRKGAQQRIDRAQEGLRDLEVRAPHDGVLVLHRSWRGKVRVGDTIWPGRKLAELPLTAEMQAEVHVLEADAGELAAEQKAVVTIESQPGRVFEGVIAKVDKVAQRRLRDSPIQYFEVTIALDETDSEIMKPGTRVRARISTGKGSALVLPRQAVLERGGESVVYKKVGPIFLATPVILGPSSPGRVVIESGLDEGDVVALRDPHRGLGHADGDEPAGEAAAGPRVGGTP